jgi:hypothetical protein
MLCAERVRRPADRVGRGRVGEGVRDQSQRDVSADITVAATFAITVAYHHHSLSNSTSAPFPLYTIDKVMTRIIYFTTQPPLSTTTALRPRHHRPLSRRRRRHRLRPITHQIHRKSSILLVRPPTCPCSANDRASAVQPARSARVRDALASQLTRLLGASPYVFRYIRWARSAPAVQTTRLSGAWHACSETRRRPRAPPERRVRRVC